MKEITEAPAPSSQVDIVIQNRRYGDTIGLEEKYQQPSPHVFSTVRAQLCTQSELLALNDHEELSKREIITAYTNDLALLKRYIGEFEACVKRSIYYSINSRNDHSTAWAVTDRTWASLKEQIPPMAQTPLLELPATRAAKATAELLQELKGEFELGVERVIALFALWLQLLAERQFIGLIEWTANDVCRYHYFRYQQIDDVVDIQRRTDAITDPSADYGSRVTYTQTQDVTTRHRVFQERHVHHVALANCCGVRDYTERVPERVRSFVRSIPQWLVGEVEIASGTITQEEVIRLNTRYETTVESAVLSVSKGSPAVTIGEFALIGWSSDDVAKETAVFLDGVNRDRLAIKKRVASLAWWAWSGVRPHILGTSILLLQYIPILK